MSIPYESYKPHALSRGDSISLIHEEEGIKTSLIIGAVVVGRRTAVGYFSLYTDGKGVTKPIRGHAIRFPKEKMIEPGEFEFDVTVDPILLNDESRFNTFNDLSLFTVDRLVSADWGTLSGECEKVSHIPGMPLSYNFSRRYAVSIPPNPYL
jgi:hypothetical protein